MFVTRRKPGPGRVVSPLEVCRDTGFARLSYGQARLLLDAHTAVGGVPGAGCVSTCVPEEPVPLRLSGQVLHVR
ncbi:hypothetical protein ADK57_08340 [Streptomyces sp. MMG1533]|nr:hypothetical protein [Streptomyces sp. MMG1533]KOU73787.1 hypothetical protein ADK57_08340 [Streptomyces sp. MMG1533]